MTSAIDALVFSEISVKISKTLVKNNLITNTFKKLPTHLELNQTNDYAKINDFCCRESVLLSLNELIVIEYYSRK